MEIYLIRHTTPEIEQGVCYGQSNLDCASSFDEEANSLRALLPNNFDRVYSSPLLRCYKLASFLFPKTEIIQDDRLKEMHFGDWEMQKWDLINNSILNEWMNDFVNVTVPGGENYLALYKRASAFIDELPSIDRVAIVSHGGVIRSILSHIDQVPLQESFRKYKINFGSVTVRQYDQLSKTSAKP